MKHISTIIMTAAAGLVLLALTVPASAADKGKEATLTGQATCAKCALKESDKCQTVIQVQENGKTVNYYLTDNAVGKEFHKNICEAAKKVTATGTVTEVGGKHEFAAAKIELAK